MNEQKPVYVVVKFWAYEGERLVGVASTLRKARGMVRRSRGGDGYYIYRAPVDAFKLESHTAVDVYAKKRRRAAPAERSEDAPE